ncbi:MAG: aminopeptidase, partial [Pseudarcicella sp.]|nr:aminopeptidase [Pseudarcicella sp.]
MKKKYIILGILSLILSFLVYYKNHVAYFYQQAKGGLNIAFNTRQLDEVLKDKTVSDSLKKKIIFIKEIRKYAIDSLKLSDNPKVYQTLFDQKGKPLVYLLTVAPAFEMRAVEFEFPIIGSFTYKGFFDSTMLAQEQLLWKNKGYDTEVGEAAAYSTLGWLPEPILSSMLLNYSDGKLASLIIHEMTHGTIFVKNNHELSENMANFIGEYGAKRFLSYKYGKKSSELLKYEDALVYRRKIIKHFNKGTLQLDSLYHTFSSKITFSEKNALKQQIIKQILSSKDTLTKIKSFQKQFPLPNNAFFVGFKTYHSKQNEFE